MLAQHQPILLDAACWPRLNTMLDDVDNVGLSLSLLKMFVQHRATLLAQQCCTMLASFEQGLKLQYIPGLFLYCNLQMSQINSFLFCFSLAFSGFQDANLRIICCYFFGNCRLAVLVFKYFYTESLL